MIAKLSFPKWKFLHRFVYVAGIFILIHIMLIGSHFRDFSTPIPYISIVFLSFLFYLEGLRIVAFFKSKRLTNAI